MDSCLSCINILLYFTPKRGVLSSDFSEIDHNAMRNEKLEMRNCGVRFADGFEIRRREEVGGRREEVEGRR